jgi:hypothetical protein
LIVTVNVIDDEGEPVLEVPVTVAVVVLPLVALFVPLELLEVVVLPHPVATMRDASASSANEARHRRRCDSQQRLPAATNHARVKRPHFRNQRVFCVSPLRTDVLDVVVLTVNVVDAVVVPLDKVTEGAAQVASVGRFEQVKFIVPVNPFTAVTATVTVPDAPGLETVTAGLDDER